MKSLLLVCALALTMCTPSLARTFDRCTLARELSRLGVPRDQLARWTCIAQRESNYRTDVVGKINKNGSSDYGIFQINNRYWCKPTDNRVSSNECRISCSALLTDDITNSVRCARKIQSQQGWTAWSTWRFCSGTLPSIDSCF